MADATFSYIDLDAMRSSPDISLLFPDWKGAEETVAVFSPHDDDALIGAGYAILAAQAAGGKACVFIFCRGNFGYKDAALKETIETTRAVETVDAYGAVGVPPERILRFGYSDNAAIQNMGYAPDNAFRDMFTALRANRVTRVLVPNHYREHTDHLGVHVMGAFGAPQAGDRILVDWAEPHEVKSVVEYSVWSDFDPADALAAGRDAAVRANRLIAADASIEGRVREGIARYRSQIDIIQGLLDARDARSTGDGRTVEAYLAFDPRPALDYRPYAKIVRTIG